MSIDTIRRVLDTQSAVYAAFVPANHFHVQEVFDAHVASGILPIPINSCVDASHALLRAGSVLPSLMYAASCRKAAKELAPGDRTLLVDCDNYTIRSLVAGVDSVIFIQRGEGNENRCRFGRGFEEIDRELSRIFKLELFDVPNSVNLRVLTAEAVHTLDSTLLRGAYVAYAQSGERRGLAFKLLYEDYHAQRDAFLQSQQYSAEIEVRLVVSAGLAKAFVTTPQAFSGVRQAFSRFVLTQDGSVRAALDRFGIASLHLVHLYTRAAAAMIVARKHLTIREPTLWRNETYIGTSYQMSEASDDVLVRTATAGSENVYHDSVDAIVACSLVQNGLSRLVVRSAIFPCDGTHWLFQYIPEVAMPSSLLFFSFDNIIIVRLTAAAGGNAEQLNESAILYKDTEYDRLERMRTTVVSAVDLAAAIKASLLSFNVSISVTTIARNATGPVFGGDFVNKRNRVITAVAETQWANHVAALQAAATGIATSASTAEASTYGSRVRCAATRVVGFGLGVVGLVGLSVLFRNRATFFKLYESAFVRTHLTAIKVGDWAARVDIHPQGTPGYEGTVHRVTRHEVNMQKFADRKLDGQWYSPLVERMGEMRVMRYLDPETDANRATCGLGPLVRDKTTYADYGEQSVEVPALYLEIRDRLAHVTGLGKLPEFTGKPGTVLYISYGPSAVASRLMTKSFALAILGTGALSVFKAAQVSYAGVQTLVWNPYVSAHEKTLQELRARKYFGTGCLIGTIGFAVLGVYFFQRFISGIKLSETDIVALGESRGLVLASGLRQEWLDFLDSCVDSGWLIRPKQLGRFWSEFFVGTIHLLGSAKVAEATASLMASLACSAFTLAGLAAAFVKPRVREDKSGINIGREYQTYQYDLFDAEMRKDFFKFTTAGGLEAGLPFARDDGAGQFHFGGDCRKPAASIGKVELRLRRSWKVGCVKAIELFGSCELCTRDFACQNCATELGGAPDLLLAFRSLAGRVDGSVMVVGTNGDCAIIGNGDEIRFVVVIRSVAGGMHAMLFQMPSIRRNQLRMPLISFGAIKHPTRKNVAALRSAVAIAKANGLKNFHYIGSKPSIYFAGMSAERVFEGLKLHLYDSYDRDERQIADACFEKTGATFHPMATRDSLRTISNADRTSSMVFVDAYPVAFEHSSWKRVFPGSIFRNKVVGGDCGMGLIEKGVFAHHVGGGMEYFTYTANFDFEWHSDDPDTQLVDVIAEQSDAEKLTSLNEIRAINFKVTENVIFERPQLVCVPAEGYTQVVGNQALVSLAAVGLPEFPAMDAEPSVVAHGLACRQGDSVVIYRNPLLPAFANAVLNRGESSGQTMGVRLVAGDNSCVLDATYRFAVLTRFAAGDDFVRATSFTRDPDDAELRQQMYAHAAQHLGAAEVPAFAARRLAVVRRLLISSGPTDVFFRRFSAPAIVGNVTLPVIQREGLPRCCVIIYNLYAVVVRDCEVDERLMALRLFVYCATTNRYAAVMIEDAGRRNEDSTILLGDTRPFEFTSKFAEAFDEGETDDASEAGENKQEAIAAACLEANVPAEEAMFIPQPGVWGGADLCPQVRFDKVARAGQDFYRAFFSVQMVNINTESEGFHQQLSEAITKKIGNGDGVFGELEANVLCGEGGTGKTYFMDKHASIPKMSDIVVATQKQKEAWILRGYKNVYTSEVYALFSLSAVRMGTLVLDEAHSYPTHSLHAILACCCGTFESKTQGGSRLRRTVYVCTARLQVPGMQNDDSVEVMKDFVRHVHANCADTFKANRRYSNAIIRLINTILPATLTLDESSVLGEQSKETRYALVSGRLANWLRVTSQTQSCRILGIANIGSEIYKTLPKGANVIQASVAQIQGDEFHAEHMVIWINSPVHHVQVFATDGVYDLPSHILSAITRLRDKDCSRVTFFFEECWSPLQKGIFNCWRKHWRGIFGESADLGCLVRGTPGVVAYSARPDEHYIRQAGKGRKVMLRVAGTTVSCTKERGTVSVFAAGVSMAGNSIHPSWIRDPTVETAFPDMPLGSIDVIRARLMLEYGNTPVFNRGLLNYRNLPEGEGFEQLYQDFEAAVHLPHQDYVRETPGLAKLIHSTKVFRGQPVGIVQHGGFTSSLNSGLSRYGAQNFTTALSKLSLAQQEYNKNFVKAGYEEGILFLLSRAKRVHISGFIKEHAELKSLFAAAIKQALKPEERDMLNAKGDINIDFLIDEANADMVGGNLSFNDMDYATFFKQNVATGFFTKRQTKVKIETPLFKFVAALAQRLSDEGVEKKLREYCAESTTKAHQPVSATKPLGNHLGAPGVALFSWVFKSVFQDFIIFAGGPANDYWEIQKKVFSSTDNFISVMLDISGCDSSHEEVGTIKVGEFMCRVMDFVDCADLPEARLVVAFCEELQRRILESWVSRSLDGLFSFSTLWQLMSGLFSTFLLNTLKAILNYLMMLGPVERKRLSWILAGGDDSALIFEGHATPLLSTILIEALSMGIKVEYLFRDGFNLHSLWFDRFGVYAMPSKVAAKFLGALYPEKLQEAAELCEQRIWGLRNTFSDYWGNVEAVARACHYSTLTSTMCFDDQFQCIIALAGLCNGRITPWDYVVSLPCFALSVDSQVAC